VSKVYRVCAVCGKRHGPTYGFRHTLRRLGIAEGDKAVPACVVKLQKQVAKRNAEMGIVETLLR
jgi:hypothetical protein